MSERDTVTALANTPDAAPGAGGAAHAGAARARLPRRALHGVVLLDKPLHWSSNDALQKVKRLFRAEKAGHTGTLDPLATGLLPLCFGAATKFSQVALDADKRYEATLQLGVTTTTGDREGEVMARCEVNLDRTRIEAACAQLTGTIDQMPPMHSALKHEGKALYEYARQGITVERASRRVTLHAIDIVRWDHDVLVIDVRCSKGTYVRTLAEDLGRLLGCGAHLSALRRTGSGALEVSQAVTIEHLQSLTEEARDALLQPVECLIADWPEVHLSADEAGRFLSGLRRRIDHADAEGVRVYGPHPLPSVGHAARIFLGSAHIKAGELIVSRLLSPIEVQGQIEQTRPPD